MKYNYENFIRGAFSIDNDDLIDKNKDPAMLATSDGFTESKIQQVKAAVGYSMCIFYTYIINNYDNIDDSVYSNMERILSDLMNASNLNVINDLIIEYKNISNEYVKFKWNA